jgi:hypothetical protein
VGARHAELIGKFIEEIDPLILVEKRLHLFRRSPRL